MVVHVGLDEPSLLFGGWVLGGITDVGRERVVIVVGPFGEVIGEL